ncbi:MAG: hypothetical protein DI535_13145 [Citrobacter freundii]|nr:MAG: hypothetical protein DI535_13145 [Citrobacter freundii]
MKKHLPTVHYCFAFSLVLILQSTVQGQIKPRTSARQQKLLPVTGILLNPKINDVWANVTLSNLVAPTAVNADLLPGVGNSLNLGSSSIGWKALHLNDAIYINGFRFLTGDISGNTFTGIQSGVANNGINNTGNGFHALYSNTSGSANVAVGYGGLALNTTGENNIAIGANALGNNSDGVENIAIGTNASFMAENVSRNVAIGFEALYNNLGQSNMAVGYQAMYNNHYGEINSAFGFGALGGNTEGWFNSAFGYGSLQLNNGVSNTAAGTYSAFYNQSGSHNVALGYQSLINNASGNNNVAVGSNAGFNGSELNAITFVGASSGGIIDNIFNSTAIGSMTQVTASNQVRIGNDLVTSIGGYANWTNLSDGRFKKNMKEDVPGLEFIEKLRPVTYTLDIDGLEKALETTPNLSGKGAMMKGMRAPSVEQKQLSREQIAARQAKASIIHTGFVAQEVEKAAKELGYDFSGVDAPKSNADFYGLRYAEFVVPLVKAVQQLHTKTNEIDELKKKNTALEEKNAQLEERLKKIEALVLKGESANNISATLSAAQLDQNAPNPFSSSTIINYTIPENEGAGRLVITDMKGATIRSFNLNGKGRGQVQLNKGSLAAGEYVYSLWVGERMVTSKRMTVAR